MPRRRRRKITSPPRARIPSVAGSGVPIEPVIVKSTFGWLRGLKRISRLVADDSADVIPVKPG
jgi:hypothetical protein